MYILPNNISFPNEIIIGGIVYKVVMVHDLRSDEGAKLDGHIVYGPCEIRIDDALCPQMQWQVMAHEIVHGILTQSGQEVKEDIVDVIAYGIVGCIQSTSWKVMNEPKDPTS